MAFQGSQFATALELLNNAQQGGDKTITTYEQLGATFYPNVPVQVKQRRGTSLPALKKAVERITTQGFHANAGEKQIPGQKKSSFDFFFEVLPSIIKSAASIPQQFPDGKIPQLVSGGGGGRIVVSRQQAHAILSCGFLGLLPKLHENFGDLDYTGLVFSSHHTSVERIICQLVYFDYVHLQFGGPAHFLGCSGALVFERVVLPSASVPNWAECPAPLISVGAARDEGEEDATPSAPVVAGGEGANLAGTKPPTGKKQQQKQPTLGVVVDDDTTIEDAPGIQSQVDFANKQLMIGTLIPSMTQEEVMFSIRPEMFLCLPFFDTLAPNEAVIAYGAKRYTDYSGYLETFQVTGVHYDNHTSYEQRFEPCIVAIDAIVNRGDQFEGPLLRRDLAKAYVGYHNVPHGAKISTGNWGCGAFRGDPFLKYLQQVMALAASNWVTSQQKEDIVTAAGRQFQHPNDGVPPVSMAASGDCSATEKTFTYCTFRKPALAADLDKLTKLLAQHRITVAQAYYWLNEYGEKLVTEAVPPLNRFLLQKISGLEKGTPEGTQAAPAPPGDPIPAAGVFQVPGGAKTG